MTLSLHQGEVTSSQITHTQLSNIHTLAPYTRLLHLDISNCTLFFNLPQPHHNGIPPLSR